MMKIQQFHEIQPSPEKQQEGVVSTKHMDSQSIVTVHDANLVGITQANSKNYLSTQSNQLLHRKYGSGHSSIRGSDHNRSNRSQGYNLKVHVILSMDELEYIAEKHSSGEDFNFYPHSDDDQAERNTCEIHPQNYLSLYCKQCDRYICTKCLIKERDQHYDHEIIETNDLYQKAMSDLQLNVELNENMHKKSNIM